MKNVNRHPIFSATQRDVMRPFFEQHLSEFFSHASSLEGLQIRFELKYHHNLNIFYHLTLRRSDRRLFSVIVIGKSGMMDSRRVSYHLQQHLWKQGFSRAPHLINRPLAFVRRWNLHLFEELHGPLLSKVFRRHSKRWILRVNRNAATWLKKLHTSPTDDSQLRILRRSRLFQRVFLSFRQFSKIAFHEEWNVLHRIATRLQRDLASQPPKISSLAMTHGDFGQHNIVVFPKGIGVIDFDSAALFDPAYDAASYLTQMIYGKPGLRDTGKFSSRESNNFKKTFLQTYAIRNPIVKTEDWQERLEFYYQFFLLKISLHILTWLPGSVSEKKRALQPIFEEIIH